MSGPGNKSGGFSRRSVAIGGGIAAALGIAALGVTVPGLLKHHYRKSPYDDLLAQLVDRDAATKLGADLMSRATEKARAPEFKSWLAATLRQRLNRRTLAEATNTDLAEGALEEVGGWVLPMTLTMLCTLAALES